MRSIFCAVLAVTAGCRSPTDFATWVVDAIAHDTCGEMQVGDGMLVDAKSDDEIWIRPYFGPSRLQLICTWASDGAVDCVDGQFVGSGVAAIEWTATGSVIGEDLQLDALLVADFGASRCDRSFTARFDSHDAARLTIPLFR
jgi:hypothetical protein